MLLAVDPSVRSPGAAFFMDNRLVACARVAIKDDQRVDVSEGARWLGVATTILAWASGRGALRGALTLVYERPQIYTWAKGKGDPNDLIGLAGVGAALTGRLAALVPHFTVLTPKPDEWAGQISKVCPVCKGKAKRKCKTCEGSAFRTPRGQRIMARLDAAERALVPDQHDALDAVGIGLFALGRYGVQRVYSNGQNAG